MCVFSIKDLSTILKSNGYIINKVMTVYDAAIGEKQVARENLVTLAPRRVSEGQRPDEGNVAVKQKAGGRFNGPVNAYE